MTSQPEYHLDKGKTLYEENPVFKCTFFDVAYMGLIDQWQIIDAMDSNYEF